MNEFEKNSLGWQISQFQQQVGEWLELQLSHFGAQLPNLPKWSLPGWLINFIAAIAWLLLGLVVFWLALQLWRLLEPYLYSVVFQTGNSTHRVTTQARELSLDEWLKRSQAYLSQANYHEACRCLYMAMLQRLDETAIAPHQLSRTDGEYLQLVQQLPLSQSYQTLITTHEQLCFGDVDILPETYNSCQQAYLEIVRGE